MFADGNLEQNGAKCPIVNKLLHLHMGTQTKTVLNMVVLNDQFGNKVFNSQIGIRNKIILIYQFGSKLLHLQIGNRNKAVLNGQFGNDVFHAQIGNWNRTVLIYQFENNMFYSQLGTQNELFLIYTRVNILCLSWKKAAPLIINRNTEMRNSQY